MGIQKKASNGTPKSSALRIGPKWRPHRTGVRLCKRSSAMLPNATWLKRTKARSQPLAAARGSTKKNAIVAAPAAMNNAASLSGEMSAFACRLEGAGVI